MDETPDTPPPPVLVVIEDHPELREVLLHALGEEGYDVVAVRDEDEALEIIGERQVDLVIADLAESGEGVAQLPVIADAHPELPTIVFSEQAGPAGIFFGPWETDGTRRTLRRPFKLADLVAAAREAVGEREPAEDTAES